MQESHFCPGAEVQRREEAKLGRLAQARGCQYVALEGSSQLLLSLSRARIRQKDFTRAADNRGYLLFLPSRTLDHQKSWFAALYLFLALFEDALWGGEPCPSRMPGTMISVIYRHSDKAAIWQWATALMKVNITTRIGRITATVFGSASGVSPIERGARMGLEPWKR